MCLFQKQVGIHLSIIHAPGLKWVRSEDLYENSWYCKGTITEHAPGLIPTCIVVGNNTYVLRD
jgi:hypothetical protein